MGKYHSAFVDDGTIGEIFWYRVTVDSVVFVRTLVHRMYRAIVGRRADVRGKRGVPTRVTLYGKPGCHLCEDAEALLFEHESTNAITVGRVDITSDPALFRLYDIRIPVLRFEDGTELCAPLRAPDLKRKLKRLHTS